MNFVPSFRAVSSRLTKLFSTCADAVRRSTPTPSPALVASGCSHERWLEDVSRLIKWADCDYTSDLCDALKVCARLHISLPELLSFRFTFLPETGAYALTWLNPPRAIQEIFEARRESLELGDNDFAFGSGKHTDVRRYQQQLQELRAWVGVRDFSWKDFRRGTLQD